MKKQRIIKLDTSKDGLNAIWKPYEIETIHELLDHGERTSGQVYSEINLRVEIGRTSVIFFLNRLVDAGLATYRAKTGKGGIHRVYKLTVESWADFNNVVIDRILFKLYEIFPNCERIEQAIR